VRSLLLFAAVLVGCGSAPEVEPVAVEPPEWEAVDEPVAVPLTRSYRKVVIDAGHGGEDEGAQAASGILEKDIALRFARETARALRRAGFEVVETRSDDSTLTLDRRTELSNASGAGVFISIHANSAPVASAQGVEIYSVDLASDEAAERLAARENRAHAMLGGTQDRDLGDALVADLAMGARAASSRRLAETLQREVVRTLNDFYGRRTVRDRGARTAPFWVLVDTEMPAVLVEVGYLTHPAEERRVRTRGYQELMAQALVRGIEDFTERAERAHRESDLPRDRADR
jgi:N-acetylmuramoyl-L-alanine amidase